MSLPRVSRLSFACFALFAMVALLMVTGVTDALDAGILQTIGSWRTPGWTSAMRVVEQLGDGKVEIPLALLICALLWTRRDRASAGRFAALCLGVEAAYLLAKLTFHRPRPTILTHLGEGGWYSFPSGHSMLGPVVWGLGLVLLGRLAHARWIRVVCWTLGVTMCVALAACRVYLGVHYPTDVVAGVALGTGFVLWWWDSVVDHSTQ